MNTQQVDLHDTVMQLEGYADDNHNSATTLRTTATADHDTKSAVNVEDDSDRRFYIFQEEYVDPLCAVYDQYTRVFKHLQEHTGCYSLTLD
jgi:hypothetical protein